MNKTTRMLAAIADDRRSTDDQSLTSVGLSENQIVLGDV